MKYQRESSAIFKSVEAVTSAWSGAIVEHEDAVAPESLTVRSDTVHVNLTLSLISIVGLLVNEDDVVSVRIDGGIGADV